MKIFLKPSVKPSEKFFVIRSEAAGSARAEVPEVCEVVGVLNTGLLAGMVAAARFGFRSGDDVVVSPVSEVTPVESEVSVSQVAEFLLGVSVEDGRERLLPVSVPSAPLAEWQGAVALEVLRELRRGRDVFVLHGVVNRVGGVESVTVWGAEVHVTPARVELFEGALARTKVKFESRVQSLAELAWLRACGRDGVSSSVPVTASVRAPVSAAVEPDGFDESMLWMPEGYEEVDAAE
ncbi:hypothetical protein Q0M94_17925 (plasmid) [Deinococcus radiomollis]|uniref:hypothetical protein n=1 Tax=Deinococcus radiomollis TaxID=468916 RepID=UPI00389299BF